MRVFWKPLVVPSYKGTPTTYGQDELNNDPASLYKIQTMPKGEKIRLVEAETLYLEELGHLLFETEDQAEFQTLLQKGVIEWAKQRGLQIILDGSEYLAVAA